LILSEKIKAQHEADDVLNTQLHHLFKKVNGYIELEISQKRTALENVLIPETLATHQNRLHQAGFQQTSVWFQCFNFSSIIAVK